MTDPEGFGIARPGGQVTGILITLDTLPAKQLQLALEVLPGASRIGLLSNANNQVHVFYLRNAEAAAATFGRKLVVVEVRARHREGSHLEPAPSAQSAQSELAYQSSFAEHWLGRWRSHTVPHHQPVARRGQSHAICYQWQD
jgi:hypothetical protein